jgi:hypothetical protein
LLTIIGQRYLLLDQAHGQAHGAHDTGSDPPHGKLLEHVDASVAKLTPRRACGPEFGVHGSDLFERLCAEFAGRWAGRVVHDGAFGLSDSVAGDYGQDLAIFYTKVHDRLLSGWYGFAAELARQDYTRDRPP